MKKRNALIFSILTLAAIALFTINVSAQPPEGKEKCNKPYSKDCDKKQKRDCDKKAWKREKHAFDILQYSQELGLSAKQVEKIKQIKLAYNKETISLQAEVEVLALDLKEFHRDYSVDMDTITKKVRQMEAKKGDKQIAKYRMIRDIRKVLTDKQRTRLREIMQQKMASEK